MCRYAFHVYKEHYACFSCRRVFRKAPHWELVHQTEWSSAYRALIRFSNQAKKRKALEETLGISLQEIEEAMHVRLSVCPRCAGQMSRVGRDFRAPLARDIEAWEILSVLVAQGFDFTSCGCSVGYTPPTRKADLPAWLATHTRYRQQPGQQLLAKIAAKYR